MSTTARNIKFVLPPTAPLRYKTACFSTNIKVIDVLDKLSDLCHFVNFAECGYGLYLPKGNGNTRGRWLENDKLLSDYPLNLDECIELRKRPGFRSNPNMTPMGSLALKEGNALRYSPLTRLWTPCILRLYNVKLAICIAEHDNNPDVILFASVTNIAEESGKKYAFFISVEDTKTTFRCRNNAEMLEWVKVLIETVSLVNPNYDPPTPRKESLVSSPSPTRAGVSFLNLRTPRDDPEEPSVSGSSSPRSGTALSPREERKKYSFLTLRNKKSKGEKESSFLSLRQSKSEPKREKEKDKKEKDKHKKDRDSGSTSGGTSPALSSVPAPIEEEEKEEVLVRARSHSAASTTTNPTVPPLQLPVITNLITGRRNSNANTSSSNLLAPPNDGEVQNLREKLQFQTDQTRQLEEKYQKLLMKYSDINKYHTHSEPSPPEPTPEEQQPPQPKEPLKKSASTRWRTFTLSPSFSRKSDPEVLELKLELQQAKAENRIMKLQLDRRSDRDAKSGKSERKRTSPRSRKALRESMDRDSSLRRLDRERSGMSISVSNSEDDLSGLASGSHALTPSGSERSISEYTAAGDDDSPLPRSASEKVHASSAAQTRGRSGSEIVVVRSRSEVVQTQAAESDSLRKEVATLREQLAEQQRLLKREEEARTAIEREFKAFRARAMEVDENAMVDMEGITRILQQSLSELKEKLEAANAPAAAANGLDDDFDDGSYGSDGEE